MIAVREEELAAQTAGIDVFRYKMISLVINNIIGVARGVLAHYMTFIQPKMFSHQVDRAHNHSHIRRARLYFRLGLGGSSAHRSSYEILRAFEIWKQTFYGAAVILIMVSRPKGLMGGMELTPSGIRKAMAKETPCARQSKASCGGAEGEEQ